jgi:hypothetical protein
MSRTSLGYVIPSVGNLTEEKSRLFNEISDMAILAPIVCRKYNAVFSNDDARIYVIT